MSRANVICFCLLLLGLACYAPPPFAEAADTGSIDAADLPVIESIVDRDSGAVLWSSDTPLVVPRLRPGQAILLKGRNFGPGPITAARPGLQPPAGGEPLEEELASVAPSPPEPDGKELSKVLFGNVRALERNISSYGARIDAGSLFNSLLGRLQGKVIDYFVEPYDPLPDTWTSDIYGWSDTEIDLTVPITAYEGPVRVVRIPLAQDYIIDLRTGEPLRYRDPNTARVVIDKTDLAFVDGWRIARTADSPVLASNAVAVTIAEGGEERSSYAASATADEQAILAARRALAAAAMERLEKSTPTLRSAADQYAYGEKAYWAWDWNLALPHFVLGIDWDGIFGFRFDSEDRFVEMLVQKFRHRRSDIPQPEIEADGYDFPVLRADGTVEEERPHKAFIDRITGEGVRPFPSFGAVPLLPEPGTDGLVAPPVAFEAQDFNNPTPYPIGMAIRLVSPPLLEGRTRPTGWVGYVYAEATNPLIGGDEVDDWIGFGCAACHASRVTFEYEPGGRKVSRIFNGIPNPDWRASFLALSGRAMGLVGEEELPLAFIRHDHPAGILDEVGSDWRVRMRRFLGLDDSERMQELSAERIDKTLLLYSLPPGATEATLFSESGASGDYANDYLYSPLVIPIITNHTAARRALSHSELMDGFEGAYLHGEEPEGARGPMWSRALQDLTLYVSTLRQDDELLRRIGIYRWLKHRDLLGLLGGDGAVVNEGTFLSFGMPADRLTKPSSFPPLPSPDSGLGAVRDAAVADPGGTTAMADAFAVRFPALAEGIVSGAGLFTQNCGGCHVPGNADMWTNEDMHPISAAGGADPVGRFFSPSYWQRRTQSIRTSILENLFWVQRRGLLSDGHVDTGMPDNMDGLAMLVHPDRCQAPLNADGSVDLAAASDLYKRLYTIRKGDDHSYRIPSEGMAFELYTRFGPTRDALVQVKAPRPDLVVSEAEDRFVARHAYFAKGDDGYYYWDYQKMRRDYGILEFGLDPDDPQQAARIGGLPAAPHPWCMPPGATPEQIDDLVLFLLTL